MKKFFAGWRTRIAAALPLACIALAPFAYSQSARFDLAGPSIEVRVTRDAKTLPIAYVPNLQPGDKLWLHPNLPPTQSVHYLLIAAFLRGTTNPPPDNWFTRIATWDPKVREEGVSVIVPDEAQQAILFLAPETGGDFTTLKKAVRGRPGVFVRASQDLAQAGFEQSRIEKYVASMREVPPSDPNAMQNHSTLLARTLNLKPNTDCFKLSVDMQYNCLTQSGNQTLLDDSHAQDVIAQLSNGPNSDFINQASATGMAGGGTYSAYVGAAVDLFRILGSLHTAVYKYIPAISFPDEASLNLRLNAAPSFLNPKSVIVIGLPSITKAIPPPLRAADANFVTCLLRPKVVLPLEGAPLVFSTGFAHDLVLHLNTPGNQKDIPLVPDAYQGGLIVDHAPERKVLPGPTEAEFNRNRPGSHPNHHIRVADNSKAPHRRHHRHHHRNLGIRHLHRPHPSPPEHPRHKLEARCHQSPHRRSRRSDLSQRLRDRLCRIHPPRNQPRPVRVNPVEARLPPQSGRRQPSP